MSFRYMNPGMAELLDVTGGTTLTDKKYNPYSGTAFWQSSNNPAVILPEVPQEIYIHATVYLNTPTGDYPRCDFFPTDNKTGISLEYGSYRGWECDTLFDNTQNGSINGEASYLKQDELHEVLVYMKAGNNSDGIIAASINGKEVIHRTGNVTLSKNVRIRCTNNTFLLSNLILSDMPIDSKEHVILLPVKSTETDMATNEDGSYTADKDGQYLLQIVDAESLLKKYGGSTKITGLGFIGNPAYTTGSELTKLTAVQKADGIVTEIGSAVLSTDSAAIVRVAGKADLSLADLGKYQIGVKAGVQV